MTHDRSADERGEPGTRASAASASRRAVLKATGTGLAAATGLGTVGSATAADSGIPTPWLHREGNEMRDPTGSQVILRGVNIPDPKRLDHTVPARGKNWDHMITHATDPERDWHANVVRVPVHPGDIAELPPVPVADVSVHQPVAFSESELIEYCETYLDPVVEFCRERSVYCIVDYHRHWGKGDLPWHDDALDEEARLFWETIAPRYAEDPHVLFEVYNEPTLPAMYENDWYNAKYAGVWRRWKKVAQPWVDTIREHAPRNPILIGSPGWSAMPEGAQIEEFDGENLLYTYHIYGGHGLSSDEEFDGREAEEGTNAVWKDVPLFMTEFGWEPGQERWISGTTDGFGSAVSEWADERPIHWTAWCFDITWLPSMFSRAFVDGDPDDTVGDPYSESIPELCADPPCEWNLLGEDEGAYSEYAGAYIRDFLADRKADDIPTVDHDDTPPAAPDVTVERVAARDADLTWSAVDTGGSDLDRYAVTVDGRTWLETTATTVTVEDLLAGTSHDVAVRAVDSYGNVGAATTVTVETSAVASDPPGPVTGLTLADRTYRSVTLAWSAPAEPVGRYVVTVDGEEHARLRPDETQTTIEGLSLDAELSVRVAPLGPAGTAGEAVRATVRPRPARATGDDILVNDFEGTDPLRENSLGGWVGGGLSTGVEDGILRVEWDNITYHGTTVEVDASETPRLAVKARGDAGYELSSLALSIDGQFDKKPVGDFTDDRIDTEWSVVEIDLAAAGATLDPPGQLQFDSVWGTAGGFDLDRLWLTGEDDPSDGITLESPPVGPPATPADQWTERVGATSVEIAWESVASATSYAVSVGDQTVETTATTATVDGLDSATEYAVTIVAINDAGRSDPATTTVTTAPAGPDPIAGAQPTDPDGDSLYEDLNGNSEVDFPDVNLLFQNRGSIEGTDQAQYYDFTGDGSINLQDVISIFRMV